MTEDPLTIPVLVKLPDPVSSSVPAVTLKILVSVPWMSFPLRSSVRFLSTVIADVMFASLVSCIS